MAECGDPVRQNQQVTPHEAGSGGRFRRENAAEMGARGAAKREQNARDRVAQTRQALAIHAQEAARTLGAILTSDARDADKVKAAVAILDRVGVGPHSTQEQSIGVSLVAQWIAELDETEARTNVESHIGRAEAHTNPGLRLSPRALPRSHQAATDDPDTADHPPA